MTRESNYCTPPTSPNKELLKLKESFLNHMDRIFLYLKSTVPLLNKGNKHDMGYSRISKGEEQTSKL